MPGDAKQVIAGLELAIAAGAIDRATADRLTPYLLPGLMQIFPPIRMTNGCVLLRNSTTSS